MGFKTRNVGIISDITNVEKNFACADPRFFSEGVQAWWPENSLDKVFFVVFLVLNLFYSLQRGSNGFITEKKL